MTPVLVAVLVLGAATPWWVARSAADRRPSRLVAAPGTGTAGRGVRRRTGAEAVLPVDATILLGLLAAALDAGASVPRALHAVGRAVEGDDGAVLERVAASLLLGSSWSAAWSGAPPRLDVVGQALGPAWEHGVAPSRSLRVAARHVRADRQATAAVAAARLGVRLVLPLGVCYLPAFVLMGLVPLLISLGTGLLG